MHGKTSDHERSRHKGQGWAEENFSLRKCTPNAKRTNRTASYMVFRSWDLVLDLVIPISVVDPSPRFSLNLQLGEIPLQRHLIKMRQDNAELHYSTVLCTPLPL